MAQLVYVLCGLTSLICTVLLIRRYRQNRIPLLFWSALCFLILTVNNVLLFVDFIILPREVDLAILRGIITLVAIVSMLWGLISIRSTR